MFSLPYSSINYGPAPNINSGDFGYAQSYDNAARLAAQAYDQVMQGYQGVLGTLATESDRIRSEYGALEGRVMGTLQGIEDPHRQAIQDRYAAAAADTQQWAINQGLGGFTTLPEMQRGVNADREKAELALSGQMGQLKADTQSRIGLAGLGYAGEALGLQAGLAQGQLGFMSNYPLQSASLLPDAQRYGTLAEQRRQFDAQMAFQRAGYQDTTTDQITGYNWYGGVGTPIKSQTTTRRYMG